MGKSKITSKEIVAEVLERAPQVIPVFFKHRMQCVGCSMAPFDLLEDAAHNYGIPTEKLMDDINIALSEDKETREQAISKSLG